MNEFIMGKITSDKDDINKAVDNFSSILHNVGNTSLKIIRIAPSRKKMKKQWYDVSCRDLKRNVHSALHELNSKPHDPQASNHYFAHHKNIQENPKAKTEKG
jgi:hypothetical protein